VDEDEPLSQDDQDQDHDKLEEINTSVNNASSGSQTTAAAAAAKTKEDLMKKLADKKRELLMRQYGGEAS
jgi:hypothetical protein